MRSVRFMGAALVAGAWLSAAAQADVITEWNEEWLDTIRAVGGAPCPLARGQAALFVSIYEAVNSVDRDYDPYLEFIDFTGPVDKSAAAAAAAHRALTTLYPARTAQYNALYNAQLADIADGPAETNGVALGRRAADAILAARSTDRTDSEPEYVYQDIPGAYRPTPPDFTTPPFNPGWGTTKPWAMIDGRQFRPTGPLGYYRMERLLKSDEYARQFREVKLYGRRSSNVRTEEQTEIAWFWANDRNGTFKPPGHLLHATQVVSENEGLSLEENARLFALCAIGMADAGLVAWDQKYSTSVDLWRPVSAIRLAHTDSNPKTAREKGWQPLLDFSPPFPAYTSGHATFGAVHAAVMRGYFGTDDMTFTIGTDEPVVANVTRTFHSFSEAARENGLSRVYLGVHFRCDADSAFSSGTLLGNYVVNNMLLPRDCAGDLSGDGVVNATDMRAFNDAYFIGSLVADLNADNDVTTADYQLFVEYYFAGCD